jgi:nucleotide-binding universal stress UspA family protein
MKNILVPTDFSENAWNAIEYALQFFSESACNFYLLHVNTASISEDENLTYSANQQSDYELLVKPSKVRLQETLHQINESFPINPKHRFFTISDSNYMIDSIRKQVEEKHIDLIVMGTKGESCLKKLPIGSNAGNVITKVKCTTIVVPENAKFVKPKEIAFPTDFSIFCKTKVLQPISDIMETHNAAVRVLHINRFGDALTDEQQRNKDYLNDYFENYPHSFHFLTNKHIEDAVQKFVDNREINMIAMLAKNLNYFHKILFHPTVKEISYYKDIPFLVLH